MYEAIKIIYNPETHKHEIWYYSSFYEETSSDIKWDWLPWFGIEDTENWENILINAIKTIQKNNK